MVILLVLMERMLVIHLILKQKTSQTDNNGIIDNVEMMVPLKYLRNFWRTLEVPLINSEVNLILTWSADCVIIYTMLQIKFLHSQ